PAPARLISHQGLRTWRELSRRCPMAITRSKATWMMKRWRIWTTPRSGPSPSLARSARYDQPNPGTTQGGPQGCRPNAGQGRRADPLLTRRPGAVGARIQPDAPRLLGVVFD